MDEWGNGSGDAEVMCVPWVKRNVVHMPTVRMHNCSLHHQFSGPVFRSDAKKKN
jgi:hypothetical protein